MITIQGTQFGYIWDELLGALMTSGDIVNPRGRSTREIRNVQVVLTDARACVLVNEGRKANFRFMVAEWLWIWYGRDDVATIRRYNKAIAQFSDDGISFNGAYGKAIMPSWPYLIQTLIDDPNSRQSVLVIFRQPGSKTKDVPCTISLQFLIRDGALHATVNMRSSDVWLGLPYDIFNFAMLLNTAAAQLNTDIGSVTFNLASSHLYATDYEKAIVATRSPSLTAYTHKLPGPAPKSLEEVLMFAPFSENELRQLDFDTPWNLYAEVLSTLHPFHCHPLLGPLMKTS